MNRVAPIAIMGALALATSASPAGALTLNDDDRKLLTSYARDTWRSVDALAAVGPLPADALWRTGTTWTASNYTSPTNIAAYLWSTLAAEGLGLINHEEAGRRIGITMSAIGRLERSHGFFYNWYDPRTGDRIRTWPGGAPIRGFLSTVDNAWIAAALMMVARSRPEFSTQAEALLGPMNFGFFYDPHDPSDPHAHPGLLRGGFWTDGGGEFADFHYGVLNTEPRMASYIGIARGDLPREHYYRMVRSTPEPTSPTRIYGDVPVVEASRRYRGARVVPSWDGTMFEALMVPLFVPEALWAPGSWGANHRLYAQAQIEYGLNDARLGYWGISASADGKNSYHAFGVAPLGLSAEAGRGPTGLPTKVITPHASFLALPYAPQAAMANLRALTSSYPVYGPYGFLDAVDVGSGHVSEAVLVLDQGMIMASIANALGQDMLQQAFTSGTFEATIRPLIAAEQFEVGSPMLIEQQVVTPRPKSSSESRPDRPSPKPAPIASSARKRRVTQINVAGADPFVIPFGVEDRTDALGGRPSPARRRGTKSSEKRRLGA